MVQEFDQVRAGHCSSTGRQRAIAIARQWFAMIFLLLAMPWAAASERAQPVAGQGVLEVFVRDGCPHCAKAEEFLPIFAGERPGLRIVLRPVDRDAAARNDLVRYSQSAGVGPPRVPTFVFDGQVLVGFESAERTGPELAALVDRRSAPSGSVETGLFGNVFCLVSGSWDGGDASDPRVIPSPLFFITARCARTR